MRPIPWRRVADGTVPAGIGIHTGPVMRICRAADFYIVRLAGASMATATPAYGVVALATVIAEAGIGGTGTMDVLADFTEAIAAAFMEDRAVSMAVDTVAAGADTGKR